MSCWAQIFEQEYSSVMNEYRTVLDPTYTYLDSVDAHEATRATVDKKGAWQTAPPGRARTDDISACDLILEEQGTAAVL